ncbi:MAG: hypothetical protein C4518_05150 [Desulfobacteraceae bacterium]|nr:MAG: hypothetical protein C4518_05150 [Desulfobacteraceae bacterium]
MNRLITLLITILAIVLVVPAAWAEGNHEQTDQQISYQALSPAAFFGYTGIDQAAVNVTENTARVADEKRNETLNEGEARFYDLSQAVFFGYTNITPVTEKAIEGPVKTAAADCRCGKITEIKSSGSIYHHLSPAEFFYGFTQPDTKVDRCAHC